MTSPHVVVTGAYACLDDRAQNAGFDPSVTDDAGFQTFAGFDPEYTQASFFEIVALAAPTRDVIVYRIANPQTGKAECLGLYLIGTAPASGPDVRQVDLVKFRSLAPGIC